MDMAVINDGTSIIVGQKKEMYKLLRQKNRKERMPYRLIRHFNL